MIRRPPLLACALLLLSPAAADAPPPGKPLPLPGPVDAARPPGVAVGLLAVDPRDGRVVAAHDPDRALVPASTAKLFTTACALDGLGPAHRFATELRATRPPGPDGTLRGPLYVVGGGDPQLRFEEAWSLARGLVALGVRRLEGGLVGDDGVHEPAGRPSRWPASSRPDPFHAAQSGLALAWNAVEVVVRPGPADGAPARVALFPMDAPLSVAATARTGRETRIVTRLRDGEGATGVLEVGGTIRAGDEPYRTWVRLGHPTRALLATLEALLREAGVRIDAPARLGAAPAATVLLHRHESRPLATIVADINKYSSNFGAEMLLRALDARDGRAGGTDGGLARVRACLDRLGVPGSGLRLADGSGYARGSRASARALVALLRAAAEAPAWGPEFVASLPRAGEDGSLSGRLAGLEGRLRAKTGSLSGVRSLAGYARTDDGDPLVFALILNGSGESAGRVTTGAIDRLLRALLRSAPGRRPAGPDHR